MSEPFDHHRRCQHKMYRLTCEEFDDLYSYVSGKCQIEFPGPFGTTFRCGRPAGHPHHLVDGVGHADAGVIVASPIPPAEKGPANA